MPQTRQHIYGERPLRQHHALDGVVITWDDMEKFLSVYDELNRSKGTVQFYRRKLQRFYRDLPDDKTIRFGTLQHWQESLLQQG